jgi:hypothetical protein
MQRVKGNEQHHSSERVEKSAQKKLKTSLTEPALLEMDGKRVNVAGRLILICLFGLDWNFRAAAISSSIPPMSDSEHALP